MARNSSAARMTEQQTTKIERKQGKKTHSRGRATGRLPRRGMDFAFFTAIMMILAFGLVMVFSASIPWGFYRESDKFHYIRRQLMWAGVGFVGMMFMANFNYHRLKKLAWPAFIVTLGLLVAVLIPGLGVVRNGAQRWLGIGSLTFQPSEVAKIAIVILFAKLLSDVKPEKLKKFFNGFVPYLVLIGLIAGCLVLQKHMSALVIIALIAFVMLFVGGARISHFLYITIPAVLGLAGMIIVEPFRMNRIMVLFDPEKYKKDEGWQVVQSLYAIGSGGLFGLGLGQSRQKFLYLPEPHNDYIFSVLCEELGLMGAIFLLSMFVVLIWRGIKIAMQAPDSFGSFLAFGFIATIALQVIINVGVVTNVLPSTGMQLPLVSAGGSSMVFVMSSLGIVLNVSRHVKTTKL